MIKKNQLRIGNKVHVGNPVTCIATVLAILADGIEVEYQRVSYGSAVNNPGNGFAKFEDIYPILLTADILNNCGFDKGNIRIDEHGLLKILPDGRYEIIEFTDCEQYRSYDNKIEYLHQLQNLFFALADEFELTIKDYSYDAINAASAQVKAMTWQPQASISPIVEAFAEEMSTVHDAIAGFQVKAAKGEEGLLVEVLQEHLGRLVTDTDFKDCQMLFVTGRPNQYIFSYKGIQLGLVKRIFDSYQKPHQFGENNFTVSYTFEFHKINAPNTAPSASPLSGQ